MSVYLVPLTLQSQQIAGQTFTVNGPKYFSTALAGLSFACVPYGGEGIGLITLAVPNAALAAEPDVYSFPANLSTPMASADVATLSTFLTAVNVPVDQIVSGMTFAAALQVIAKIFLVAQTLHGVSGAPIFSTGTTLSTAIEDSDISPIATTPIPTASANLDTTVADSDLTPLGIQTVSSFGPFDFSGVTGADTLGDVLDSLSKQLTQTVNLGSIS
jgi:hypothetical protein